MIIIVGPSGSGKSTVIRRLIEDLPFLAFSISATTRTKRDGEIDGKDYYFLSKADFEAKAANNAFIEFEEVYKGRYYGTLSSEIERIKAGGKMPIMDIDVKGAKRIFFNHPDLQHLSIFLHPGSEEILYERLKNRGTDNEAEIKKRLKVAKEELQQAEDFKHIVYNTDLETTVSQIKSLIVPFAQKAGLMV